MLCEKCGHLIRAEDRFCTGCGEPLPGMAAPSPKRALRAEPERPAVEIDLRFRAAIAAALIGFTILNIISLFAMPLSNHALVISSVGAVVLAAAAFLYVHRLMQANSPALDRLESLLITIPTRGPMRKLIDRVKGNEPEEQNAPRKPEDAK